jgi:hypothetical protein
MVVDGQNQLWSATSPMSPSSLTHGHGASSPVRSAGPSTSA